MAPPERAAEAWFLSNGLPAVLRPGMLLHGLFARSAPALAFFAVLMTNSVLVVAVTGKHTIDIDGSPTRAEWFVLALLIVVVPVATLVGWLVSRIAHVPRRNVAAAAATLIVVAGSCYGGVSSLMFVNLLATAGCLAAIFGCTATGIGSVLGWAGRITSENLASVGALLMRALPVLLLTVLVFFNSPVWSMASVITRGRLWAALLFLFVIAAVFLISHTLAGVRPILRTDAEETGAEADSALVDTPFRDMPDHPVRIPLSRNERLNVGFVVALSQLVQVCTVAMVTGLIFLAFGLILVSPEVLDAWTHGGTRDGQLLGMTLPIPDALIQVTMFLTALTFMYLAAKAVTDKEYRAQFLDPLLADVRVTLAARDRYRTATADR